VPSGTPGATVTPAPTPGEGEWLVYTSSDAGYSFAYPPDAYFSTGKAPVDQYSNATVGFRLPGVGGYQGMQFRTVPNPQRLPIEQVYSLVYQQATLESATPEVMARTEVITVAGVRSLKGPIASAGSDFCILIPQNDKVLVVGPGHGLAQEGLHPQALALFYQVLATLSINQ
jgi:hypothetical protein